MNWQFLAFSCFLLLIGGVFCQVPKQEAIDGTVEDAPPPRPQQEAIGGSILNDNDYGIVLKKRAAKNEAKQRQKMANNRGNKARFNRDNAKAAFAKQLGANDDVEMDTAKEMRNKKTGDVIGRLRMKHKGIRIWGGKPVTFKGRPDNDGTMKPLRKPRKNLDKKSGGASSSLKADPNLSITACLTYYNYQASTMEKSSYELVWYDPDATDNSPMQLCHEVTLDGTNADGNIYSVSCLVSVRKQKVLLAWQQIESVIYGGNLRTSEIPYNSLPGITASSGMCDMATSDDLIYVYDGKMTTNRKWQSMAPIRYDCNYGIQDAINGGYGPAADCFYNAAKILQMLFDPEWGNFDDRKQICALGRMNVIAHFGSNYANAFWSTSDAAFYAGDGGLKFHPLCTCSDVVAHEMGHALTSVRSKLIYFGESGCMNEAFSDMLGETAENYIYGKNDWLIARYCVKSGNGIRNLTAFMSYDSYSSSQTVHKCSGIYNSAFYTLATWNANWDIRRAFKVFLAANSFGWTEDTNMLEGWAQVIWAAYEISEGNAIRDACDAYQVGKLHGLDCSNNEDLVDIISNC